MRLPRVRITIHRMMIAIGLIALLFGASDWGMKLNNRRIKCRVQSKNYAVQAELSRSLAGHYERNTAVQREASDGWRMKAQEAANAALREIREGAARDADQRAKYWSAKATEQREEAEGYARLSRRFEHAAFRPWEALPPEPSGWLSEEGSTGFK